MTPTAAPATPHPQRLYHLHLTPLAPGCIDLPISAPARNRLFGGRPLEPVVKAVLSRIERDPSEVTVDLYGSDPALCAPVRLPGEDRPRVLPLALIWDGAELDDIAHVIADLAARGWRPLSKGDPA